MSSLRLRVGGMRVRSLLRTWRLYAPHVGENVRLLAQALTLALGAVLMQALRPWPLKVLFDVVLLPDSAASVGIPGRLQQVPPDAVIVGACVAVLVIAILWGLFSYGQTYLTARAGQAVVFGLRARVYAHLQHLSLDFHQRRQRGDLLMRMTGDINVMRDMLVDALVVGASSLAMLLVMITVLLLMDLRLSLMVLALLPLLAATTLRFSRRIHSSARRQRKSEGRAAAMISEMLSGIAIIQAFGNEEHQAKRFGRRNRQSLRAGLRTTRLEASMARVVEVLLAVGTAAVLWYGVHRIRAGAISPGDLLVFLAYVQSSFRPMRRLARVSSRMTKAAVCAERVTECLSEAPGVRDRPDAKRARSIRGEIDFEQVSFRYPGAEKALRDVSFRIEPQSFVGIVGSSGAGKSTILALLMRLYDADRGRILIDGRDLRRYRLRSIRDCMSVVLQDTSLFGGTLRENVAFGKPRAELGEIEAAVRLAGADSFIARLPDGLETRVAEAGASLSGGERRRIAIARAFLREAPILLLDEPTSGLDGAAEAEFRATLARLAQGRTTLVVTHRLASVERADQILVLKRGSIVESGAHTDLLERGGWYARTWTKQRLGPAAPKERAAAPRRAGSRSS